ncbi:MAG: alpha-glucosidase C-terminal domain-containing protein, partial [Actinobacteria bacterium]|nr:alpha-glucosidase C-terminal domain-containing protein [Actinomycetota bacterium]
PEIGVGEAGVVDLALPRPVLAHRYDAPEGTILLLHNLADEPVTVDLSKTGLPAARGGKKPYEVFSDARYDALTPNLAGLRLNGYGYRWIRLRRGAAA